MLGSRENEKFGRKLKKHSKVFIENSKWKWVDRYRVNWFYLFKITMHFPYQTHTKKNRENIRIQKCSSKENWKCLRKITCKVCLKCKQFAEGFQLLQKKLLTVPEAKKEFLNNSFQQSPVLKKLDQSAKNTRFCLSFILVAILFPNELTLPKNFHRRKFLFETSH